MSQYANRNCHVNGTLVLQHVLFSLAIYSWWTYICGLVIRVAVVEDLAEISDALRSTVVGILLQFFLDDSHIHRAFDNREIVL